MFFSSFFSLISSIAAMTGPGWPQAPFLVWQCPTNQEPTSVITSLAPDYSQDGNYIISTVASSSWLNWTSARTSSETNARIVLAFKMSPMCLEREPVVLYTERGAKFQHDRPTNKWSQLYIHRLNQTSLRRLWLSALTIIKPLNNWNKPSPDNHDSEDPNHHTSHNLSEQVIV